MEPASQDSRDFNPESPELSTIVKSTTMVFGKRKIHHVYKPYLSREIVLFAGFCLLGNECLGRILRLV